MKAASKPTKPTPVVPTRKISAAFVAEADAPVAVPEAEPEPVAEPVAEPEAAEPVPVAVVEAEPEAPEPEPEPPVVWGVPTALL